MKLPYQVGITGGIGSGKSTISKVFQSFGVPVYDADSRAKKLMTTDGILVDQIKKEFGTLSYWPDGSLNRAHLSEVAFGNAKRLNTLNGLVHPRVAVDYQGWVAEHANHPYLIREAALLYEAGATTGLSCVILVIAPEALRLKRVLARDPQRTEASVREIMKNQWPEEEKMKRADVIIYNDDHHLVIPQVIELHQKFLQAQLPVQA